jgi:hypothetical protein
VVNDENKVFLMGKLDGLDNRWEAKKLKVPIAKHGRKAVMGLAERMSVAMSGDNNIYLFWVQLDDGVLKGHLGTILEEKQCEFTDFDINFES